MPNRGETSVTMSAFKRSRLLMYARHMVVELPFLSERHLTVAASKRLPAEVVVSYVSVDAASGGELAGTVRTGE